MTPIYNFGIKAYRLAVRLASQSNKKAKLMLDGQARTIATLRSKLDPRQATSGFTRRRLASLSRDAR